jgi:CheY-like chemotaxis protein
MASPTPLPLTIFVVEDNPVDAYLIRWVLEAHELVYELQIIDSGDIAAGVFARLAEQERQRAPTMILLDLNLPQRDGKELLRQVKSIPQRSDIRVVVVTGSADPRERVETLCLGADAYFVKPFHLQEFMQLGDVIKALIEGHGTGGARRCGDGKAPEAHKEA